jgi:predicted DNA-binding antitoxin AbrB/MazE fold protein
MQAIEVVYEDGVFKPLKSLDLEIPEGTKIAIEIPKRGLVKRCRGILGKADEKLLQRFELEATDIR